MKDFKFKDELYDLHKLILLNKDKNVKEYQSGSVIDTRNNQTYEISDLVLHYRQEIIELLNNNVLDEKAQNALTKICKSRNKDIYDTEIFTNLENNTISLAEIDNYLSNFYRKDKEKFGMPHYKSFQMLNSEATKPYNLSKAEYGGFMMLAAHIDYHNRLAHTNGKPFSKPEIMNILEIINMNTLYSYLEKLAQSNLIKKIKINKTLFIYINPYYTYKSNSLDKIAHHFFSNEVKQFLTALENKYLELLYQSFENNNEIIKM